MDFEILFCNLLIMISSTGPVWSHYTSAKPAKSVQSVNKFAQELLRNFEVCISILIVKWWILMLWPLSKVTLWVKNPLNHSVFLTFEYRKSKLRIHSFPYSKYYWQNGCPKSGCYREMGWRQSQTRFFFIFAINWWDLKVHTEGEGAMKLWKYSKN